MAEYKSVVTWNRGGAAVIEPTETLVVSLSTSHMLGFLFIAAQKGFKVESYQDEAVGTMTKDTSGKMAMTHVRLRPVAHFSGDKLPTTDDVLAMHREAHEQCYIARSVKTEVLYEPVWRFEISAGPPRGVLRQ